MNIAELRRLEAEAEPAPWSPNEGEGPTRSIANITLIVAMRNALPETLAKAEAYDALVEENERLREVIDVWKSLETGTDAELGGRDDD